MMQSTWNEIYGLLTDYPEGLTAREIARKLRIEKREVNRVLYSHQKDFVVENYIWKNVQFAKAEEIAPLSAETKNAILQVLCSSGKFKYCNVNPFMKHTGDCVIRAIGLATGMSWDDVLRELVEYTLRYGDMLNTQELYERYLDDRGWIKHSHPTSKQHKRISINRFLDEFTGSAIVTAGDEHLTYVSDGYIWDIWDCGEEIVGDYWTYKMIT